MSGYDLAVSMDQNTINGVLSQAFGLPRLANLFTGTITQDVLGSQASVTWTLNQAPVLSLAEPAANLWNAAVDAQGGHPTQVATSGLITFPSMGLTYNYAGESGTTTIAPSAIWTYTINGADVTVTPVGVILDTSGMSPNVQAIVQYIILPLVMQQAQTYTKTIQLPSGTYGGVSFGTPAMTITNQRLIMVAAIQGQPTPAIPTLSTLPTAPLFIQVSQAAAQAAATAGANSYVGQKKTFSGSGQSADYNGAAVMNAVTITLGSTDPTQVSATITYGLTCDVSIGDGTCGISAASGSM